MRPFTRHTETFQLHCYKLWSGFGDLCSVIIHKVWNFCLSQLGVLSWMRMWGLLDIDSRKSSLSFQTVALLWSRQMASALQFIKVYECISDDQSVWDSVNLTVWISTASAEEDQRLLLHRCLLSPTYRFYSTACLAPATDSTALPV